MRFKPKFEPILEVRPAIFNIKMLSDYVGGTPKVWSMIAQNDLYKDVFIKVAPIGISYSFTTDLNRDQLEELYLKDILRRKIISTNKANITRALKKQQAIDK